MTLQADTRLGPYEILAALGAGGMREARTISQLDHPHISPSSFPPACSWSSDGQYLLYTETKNVNDVWVLPLSGDKKPIPLLQTPFDENRARFSPDGRWIAYTSSESGLAEVYVQSFPPSGGKWQISTAGGFEPHWRGDGRELFYFFGGAIWAVDVSAPDSSSFKAGLPRKLFDAAITTNTLRSGYDVAPDGQRFLLNLGSVTASAVPPVRVVVNWTTGIEK